jgi:hypothetical protein
MNEPFAVVLDAINRDADVSNWYRAGHLPITSRIANGAKTSARISAT